MPRRLLGIGKSVVLWIAGIVIVLPVLLLLVVLAINATDESPSEAAQAALRVPPPPAPGERNGYVDSLGLAAPDGMSAYEAGLKELATGKRRGSVYARRSIGSQLPSCWREDSLCLDLVTAGAVLREVLEGERVLLERYRAMQAKPEFIEIAQVHASPDDQLPAYQDFLNAQRLTLVYAAVLFNSGDRAGAIAVLEREDAFYRRAATGSRSLIMKMIAFAALGRVDLFAAELARRLPASDKALMARLEAIVRPLAPAELDVTAVLKAEHAQGVRWRQTRDFVRLSDAMYEVFKSFGDSRTRPWWDALGPYLYRPNYNANIYAARTAILLKAAAVPSQEFTRTVETLRAQADALVPGEYWRILVNPIGWNHVNLASLTEDTDYIGRAHGIAALQTLVRLQIHLRAQAIRDREAIRNALAGPLGQAYANPTDGRNARFDAATGAIGFDVPARLLPASARQSSGAVRVVQDAVWLML